MIANWMKVVISKIQLLTINPTNKVILYAIRYL